MTNGTNIKEILSVNPLFFQIIDTALSNGLTDKKEIDSLSTEDKVELLKYLSKNEEEIKRDGIKDKSLDEREANGRFNDIYNGSMRSLLGDKENCVLYSIAGNRFPDSIIKSANLSNLDTIYCETENGRTCNINFSEIKIIEIENIILGLDGLYSETDSILEQHKQIMLAIISGEKMIKALQGLEDIPSKIKAQLTKQATEIMKIVNAVNKNIKLYNELKDIYINHENQELTGLSAKEHFDFGIFLESKNKELNKQQKLDEADEYDKLIGYNLMFLFRKNQDLVKKILKITYKDYDEAKDSYQITKDGIYVNDKKGCDEDENHDVLFSSIVIKHLKTLYEMDDMDTEEIASELK